MAECYDIDDLLGRAAETGTLARVLVVAQLIVVDSRLYRPAIE
jgi:hypothetical protein